MKLRSSIILATSFFLLFSCNKDEAIQNALIEYNQTKEGEGYRYGDVISLPKEVTENAENITISFGEESTSELKINPKYFHLGKNPVTFHIKTKNGSSIQQEATINLFAKHPEKSIQYDLVKEYPHDNKNFVQGFQLEGNTIYESNGHHGASQILKYTLGSTSVIASNKQSEEIFSEGATIVGDKVYQLTWRNKKGFVYDKSTLERISEFTYPNALGEGWGLTYDGEHLIVSDGSNQLYFLEVDNPSNMVKTIYVAGAHQEYTQLNELEYKDGYIYSNVWQQPIIIKIKPDTGEVVGKFDFSDIMKQNTTGEDDVLNGIAFKGENMLVTGKNWNKIYEVKIQK